MLSKHAQKLLLFGLKVCAVEVPVVMSPILFLLLASKALHHRSQETLSSAFLRLEGPWRCRQHLAPAPQFLPQGGAWSPRELSPQPLPVNDGLAAISCTTLFLFSCKKRQD